MSTAATDQMLATANMNSSCTKYRFSKNETGVYDKREGKSREYLKGGHSWWCLVYNFQPEGQKRHDLFEMFMV